MASMNLARMKFLCDAERCIECNACVTACKNENEVPWGVNRRRVVTINDGKPGERSISVACMHCSDAPCIAVCPVDCIYQTEQGVVLHSKDLCIGCGYCFYACPFGAPQFPQAGNYGSRGKMDKCTFCAGGPELDMSEMEFQKYGRNRLAEGKLPLCAEMCATKALLAGDGDSVSNIYRERVVARGFRIGRLGLGHGLRPEELLKPERLEQNRAGFRPRPTRLAHFRQHSRKAARSACIEGVTMQTSRLRRVAAAAAPYARVAPVAAVIGLVLLAGCRKEEQNRPIHYEKGVPIQEAPLDQGACRNAPPPGP